MRRAVLAALLLAPALHAAAPAAPEPKWPLAAAERARLDRTARATPPETFKENKINLIGTVPAWVFTRLGLTLEEENRRSAAAAAEMAKTYKVVATPADAAKLVADLAVKLPPAPGYEFTLAVLDRVEFAAFSPGGGRLYVSKRLLDLCARGGDRGKAMLAFLLAREVAHNVLLHCRRGYQLAELEDTLRKQLDRDDPDWREALQTRLELVGKAVLFSYSREQEYEADLFALHLCRNAGIDPDGACDAMRLLCSIAHPDAVTKDDYAPKSSRLPAVRYYLSLTADPLLRLRRLLMERDGDVESDRGFGLTRYDRTTRDLVPLKPGDVKAADRPIVFVHGLYGTLETFRPFLDETADSKDLAGRPIVVFRHPANASLSRSALFLEKEAKRLLPAADKVTFVAHSAGGLVVRFFAEALGGKFHRAVFLGTPSGGSDLAKIKAVIDVIELAGNLRLGWVNGVSNILDQGRGEIGLDLQPGSLFLQRLTGKRDVVRRYHVLYGEFIRPIPAAALQIGFTAGVRALEDRVVPLLPAGPVRDRVGKVVRDLRLPAEILRGDGVVSASSAYIVGAAENTRLPLNHIAFCRDARAVDEVMRILAK